MMKKNKNVRIIINSHLDMMEIALFPKIQNQARNLVKTNHNFLQIQEHISQSQALNPFIFLKSWKIYQHTKNQLPKVK